LSRRAGAAKLGVPQTILSKLLKYRNALKANTTGEKRKREEKCHAVDEALHVRF
jgi:hypothetical protein